MIITHVLGILFCHGCVMERGSGFWTLPDGQNWNDGLYRVYLCTIMLSPKHFGDSEVGFRNQELPQVNDLVGHGKVFKSLDTSPQVSSENLLFRSFHIEHHWTYFPHNTEEISSKGCMYAWNISQNETPPMQKTVETVSASVRQGCPRQRLFGWTSIRKAAHCTKNPA